MGMEGGVPAHAVPEHGTRLPDNWREVASLIVIRIIIIIIIIMLLLLSVFYYYYY